VWVLFFHFLLLLFVKFLFFVLLLKGKGDVGLIFNFFVTFYYL
jgi:hypothetical protein